MPDPITTSKGAEPVITGKLIPLDARLLLIDIMMAAGVRSCEVTSVARTPAEEAAAMYTNLVGTGKHQGIVEQRRLYLPPGNKVIDVFEQNVGQPRDAVIALMTARINEIGPETVSHHCRDPKKFIVWDVGPNSVQPSENIKVFIIACDAAVKDGRLLKFLSPDNSDPALHFEKAVGPINA